MQLCTSGFWNVELVCACEVDWASGDGEPSHYNYTRGVWWWC